MQVVSAPAPVPGDHSGAAVTIGAYDGVHRGHVAVLRLVRELADARGLASVCVTFDRHPAEVVRPESAPKLLTTLEQKLELLAATGHVDICYVLTFDEARSREPAEEFVREVLVEVLQARVVVVGADFHFGHRRGGNVPLLERMGGDLGFEVVGLGLVAVPGDPAGTVYSSTGIRELLAKGGVAEARQLLGRPHEVRGVVEHGDERGRELGFPTANLAVPPCICVPAEGVYAGTCVLPDGSEHPSAISFGRRPTFYQDAEVPLLEAFVLDFAGDLYGEPVKVRFLDWLHGQERFDGVDALIAQLDSDVEATRAINAR
ncbi:MAG: bifunctional riboflavin kinase/FAD synthetase [Acidimicrobiia bacterium]